MIVQMYEIQSALEAEICISLGVSHIGSVILSEENWKDSEILEVVNTCRRLAVKSCIIPLFRDLEGLTRVAGYYNPHYLHLCEALTDSSGRMKELDFFLKRDEELRRRCPEIRLMRSIPVPQKGFVDDFPSLALAKALEPVTDVFLIDTWVERPPVPGFIGVTGMQADPILAERLVRESSIPVILAGGLSPENVFDAVMRVRPAGVDSCTLTNKKDERGRPIRFKKDFRQVERFVKEALRAFRLCNSQAA